MLDQQFWTTSKAQQPLDSTVPAQMFNDPRMILFLSKLLATLRLRIFFEVLIRKHSIMSAVYANFVVQVYIYI